MSYRVGCSGWSYPHWRDSFYPKGLRQAGWFGHYSALFDTVEINNSFYRTPSDQTFRVWSEKAPPRFVYALKVNRSITQFFKLGPESYSRMEEFVRGARLLDKALGPLLLQLPPSLGRDDDRLSAFLSQPPVSGLRLAVEFRHRDWFTQEVYSLLQERGVALAVSDFKDMPVPAVATTGWVYARFHGPSGQYWGSYGDEELRSWAARFKEMSPDGYVYFNNDAEAAAPRDATRLRELLES